MATAKLFKKIDFLNNFSNSNAGYRPRQTAIAAVWTTNEGRVFSLPRARPKPVANGLAELPK